ncbi:MAG: methyltransferase [Proteobacteria bacterium]|nr:methyltransferase [Pseudomonadota bacterium]
MVLLLLCSFAVTATDFKIVEEKLKSALKSDVRTDKEKERDRNRKPISTLKFFGLEDDMKVVELVPGGGWYTKLLAPVLKENGEFIVAYGTTGVQKSLISSNDDFDHVEVAAEFAKIYKKEGARFYSLENPDLDVKKADMILTFRNYHNFDEGGRKAMNDASWDALKMGGIYGIVDHTQRHMEGDNNENGRRIDPVLVIKEVLAAGFEFVDYSDLHYRPDDELRYEVGRKSVTGNTDRFTFKFKKVKK